MTELLDYYDEFGTFQGTETRASVHQKAFWHNTIHCWLYDNEGNVYFQIRKEEQKLYTTASGHVLAGESLQEAFMREIKEEIGIIPIYQKAELIEVAKFTMDKTKKDGTTFHDRAFANTYALLYQGEEKFVFDPTEVLGIVKMKAKDVLRLFHENVLKVTATVFTENSIFSKEITIADFLVFEGETALKKYGTVLNFIAKKQKND